MSELCGCGWVRFRVNAFHLDGHVILLVFSHARPVLWLCRRVDKRNIVKSNSEVLMDPFEVRMQFLSLIRKLNASALLSSRSNLRLTQPRQLPAIHPESGRLRPQILLPMW
jgi:hypothetical protein